VGVEELSSESEHEYEHELCLAREGEKSARGNIGGYATGHDDLRKETDLKWTSFLTS
jgi:hypothetical protein